MTKENISEIKVEVLHTCDTQKVKLIILVLWKNCKKHRSKIDQDLGSAYSIGFSVTIRKYNFYG